MAVTIDQNLKSLINSLSKSINSSITAANKWETSFNAAQAENSRAWSEKMAKQSHQIEVADLKKAGLNPVLSANSGANSYVGASASANVDSNASALGSMGSSLISSLAGLKSSENSAKATTDAAKISAAASKEVAKTNSAASKYAADKSAEASKYSSDTSKSNTKYSSDKSAAASKYSSDKSAEATKYAADRSAEASRIVATINSNATRYSADMAYKAQMDKPQSSAWAMLDKWFFNNNSQVLGDVASYAGKSLLGSKSVTTSDGQTMTIRTPNTKGRVAGTKLLLSAGIPVTDTNVKVAAMYLSDPNKYSNLFEDLKKQKGKGNRTVKTLNEMDKIIAQMYPNTAMY